MGTDKFKHGRPIKIKKEGCKRRLHYNRTYIRKKANSRSPFLYFGGVDGTRTRDPRRDRPVF
ncbi:hypothetical protein CFter6_3115 [Collimonas fungivorans]|uniref:Uncharacterized protein n=1 Tax=Collimonas fungivorans TaxID=158899 RepID=A0A127PD88_9BURK|nr:hypothetical protein CFter6_3115 [Collimonas fungivorans]